MRLKRYGQSTLTTRKQLKNVKMSVKNIAKDCKGCKKFYNRSYKLDEH